MLKADDWDRYLLDRNYKTAPGRPCASCKEMTEKDVKVNTEQELENDRRYAWLASDHPEGRKEATVYIRCDHVIHLSCLHHHIYTSKRDCPWCRAEILYELDREITPSAGAEW